MHHKGFVKGLFIIVAFNVDQRGLRQRGQHLMRRLRLEDDFPGDPLPAHTAFPLIYRMEMGIGHQAESKWIDGTSSVSLSQVVL